MVVLHYQLLLWLLYRLWIMEHWYSLLTTSIPQYLHMGSNPNLQNHMVRHSSLFTPSSYFHWKIPLHLIPFVVLYGSVQILTLASFPWIDTRLILWKNLNTLRFHWRKLQEKKRKAERWSMKREEGRLLSNWFFIKIIGSIIYITKCKLEQDSTT